MRLCSDAERTKKNLDLSKQTSRHTCAYLANDAQKDVETLNKVIVGNARGELQNEALHRAKHAIIKRPLAHEEGDTAEELEHGHAKD